MPFPSRSRPSTTPLLFLSPKVKYHYLLYGSECHTDPHLNPHPHPHPHLMSSGTENPETKEIPFHYYILSPVLPNNWTVLGEKGITLRLSLAPPQSLNILLIIGKTIAMSKQRFEGIEWKDDGVKVFFTGSKDEAVTILLMAPHATVPIEQRCVFSSSTTSRTNSLLCTANSYDGPQCVCLTG